MSKVLYRKYRPQNLDEIFGQEHVVATLRSQLKSDDVAHAYLFAGPRGTGKTTVARILASELGVNEIDLIEVDAASNRGIDDIRSLRESVYFQPAQSPKKLYILDEAHMLTKEAFNALLKTLEEPPSHTHFVLCTTEPQRLPITVLSRCQRFNFELGEKELIKDYLHNLLDLEKIELGTEVVDFIAKKSGGSYRDAAGLLQGVIGLANNKKESTESVLQSLGYGAEKEVVGLKNLLLQKKAFEALVELNILVDRGIETSVILETLIEQLRKEVILSKAPSELNIQSTRQDLLRLIRGLHGAQGQIKMASPPQLPIELAILEALGVQGEASSQKANLNGESVWAKIMQEVRKYNHSLEALLKDGEPEELEGEIIKLNFRYKFHKEKIEEVENRRLVERAISNVLGRKVRVRCRLVSVAQSDAEEKQRGVTREEESLPSTRTTQIRDEKIEERDILKVAQEIFGGEIIE